MFGPFKHKLQNNGLKENVKVQFNLIANISLKKILESLKSNNYIFLKFMNGCRQWVWSKSLSKIPNYRLVAVWRWNVFPRKVKVLLFQFLPSGLGLNCPNLGYEWVSSYVRQALWMKNISFILLLFCASNWGSATNKHQQILSQTWCSLSSSLEK